MWIAFRMYLWHIGHNFWFRNHDVFCVVNCFQNVSLTYRAQLPYSVNTCASCCELLSECIFDISGTTLVSGCPDSIKLWIAFRMYLWHIGHNHWEKHNQNPLVVNCFQNVSLTYRAQLFGMGSKQVVCCELLSECIFDISGTTFLLLLNRCKQLWIAFRMYLWHIGHNVVMNIYQIPCVVNCFQNVSLTYRAQPKSGSCNWQCCCELLSECIFDISGTTYQLFIQL